MREIEVLSGTAGRGVRGERSGGTMTVFVVYSISMGKPVYTTALLDVAKKYIESRLPDEWSFRDGRYYCPYIIYDCYVHEEDDDDAADQEAM
jgi:hypothetical protein